MKHVLFFIYSGSFHFAFFMKVFDPKTTENADLGVNFFLNESDVLAGTSRGLATAPRLQELNPLCKVSAANELSDAIIKEHAALVITIPMPIAELVRLNEFCRKNSISFFFSLSGGVHTSIFSDLGSKHIVNDFNGERPIQKLITEVTPLENGISLVRYDTPEGQQPAALSTGFFEISEVKGVDGINGVSYPITHPYSDPVKTVRIPFDISGKPRYVSGGLLTEKKVPTPYPMESLQFKITNPGNTFAEPPSLVLTDLINFGSELQQHVALMATLTCADHNGGRFPRPNNVADALDVVNCAKTLLSSGKIVLEDFTLDEAFVTRSVTVSHSVFR
jgi:Ubiquitin-activating enzyme E1 four-helix bundle